MSKKLNYNTIHYLLEQGYKPRHVAIVMNCVEHTVKNIRKTKEVIEITNKFMTKEEKQRLFVLNKFLQLKPIESKLSSNNYYFITVLKFLMIPRDTVVDIYKFAPQKYVAQAYKEKAPKFQQLDYKLLGITQEEYNLFVLASYNVIGDVLNWW